MYQLLNNYVRVYRRCAHLRKTIRKQLGLSKAEIKVLVKQQTRTPRWVGVPDDPNYGD